MAPNGKSNPRINYPLWIIAISLLVIAVCMVIDSIQRQKHVPNSGPAPAVAASDETVPMPDRPAIRVATRNRRLSAPDATNENAEPRDLAAVDVSAPVVATIPASPSEVGGSQPAGYSVSGMLNSNPLGEIAGRITLRGTPPPETILKTDPLCSQRSTPLMTRNFVVGESNGLANAVVFLRSGVDTNSVPWPTNGAVILFTNCDVQPYITAVTTRQPVDFRDGEGVRHRMTLKDDSIKGALTLSPKSTRRVSFGNPHLFIGMQCLEHPWETSYICVLENPLFAVTDSNGNFDIPNVPPGTYTIEIAHQRATGTNGVLRSIIVVAGKKAELNVALDAAGNNRPRPAASGIQSARN